MPKLHATRPVEEEETTTASSGGGAVVEQTITAPPRSAAKGEWIAYAEALGADATGTKAQIIERLG